jgi:hypothetical protein
MKNKRIIRYYKLYCNNLEEYDKMSRNFEQNERLNVNKKI